jgi:hypothetical protein
MASVNFRLKSKANKNVSIIIRLSNGRNCQLIGNTGFSINPKEWSIEKNLPKQNITENKILSNNLKKLETFVLRSLNNDLSKSIVIDNTWFSNIINECFKRTTIEDKGIITNHIQHIVDNANTRKIVGRKTLGISESRKKGYITFKNNWLWSKQYI